jgi:hypothetical protein
MIDLLNLLFVTSSKSCFGLDELTSVSITSSVGGENSIDGEVIEYL